MTPKINIQAPWEVNEYLRQVITEKVEKLSTYNNKIIHADVFLKNGTHTGIDDKTIEIRLRLNGPDYFAQSSAITFEKAVTSAAEKLRKQLIKKKEQYMKK